MTPRMAGTQVEGELPPIPDSSSLLKDLRTAVDEDLRKLDEDGKLPTMGPIGDTYTQVCSQHSHPLCNLACSPRSHRQ